MNLNVYRNSESEKKRIADLMGLLPDSVVSVLDIGARDGFISKLLAERCFIVTALDLETPAIDHENIHCVKGDTTALDFPDGSFDLVFCAEVLEHIPVQVLRKACNELGRVAKKYMLIGVPYKQDLRVGRTTCDTCGKKNPPWGHVNSFDETRLKWLFPKFEIVKTSFVGETDAETNLLSCLLMDMAGNPYGTYSQEEPCVHCGAKLKSPPERNLWRKVLTRAAFYARNAQRPFFKRHPNWIHVLFKRQRA